MAKNGPSIRSSGTATVKARPARSKASSGAIEDTRTDSLPATGWQRQHLLDLDELSREEIELIFQTADAMKEVLARDVPRLPTLRGTTIVTLFYEDSTRTRASFELAGKVLGADVINISSSGSSVQKGETLLDTVRTIQAIGADLLVLRHGASGAPYLAARESTCRIVNAGDGWHAHPTQALLDAYTIRSKLGDLRGRKIVIVGDVAHSRVVRSNIWGLSTLGAEVVVCGPPTLLPFGLDAINERAAGEERDFPPVRVELDLNQAIADADVVMALRLQRERQQSGLLPSLREYARLYQITNDRLAHAKPDAFVLHPGPMNEGVEISADVAHGSRSLIEEQVSNGVAVRMAILYLLLQKEPALDGKLHGS